MPTNFPVQNILFLDIETVSQYSSYDQLPESWQYLWKKKADILLRNREEETVESVYQRAGIYAEFGKIICISCGFILGNGDSRKICIKSFYGDDEKQLLTDFNNMLNRWSQDDSKYLCAHNGKEFDFPYLCRRLIINELPIANCLNMQGKKPWDIKHLDTMEMWKFGDYKNYTSLELMAHSLGIPTPKDDIDGSMVGEVYWKTQDIGRIANYCQKDVITVAQVFLKLHGESLIPESNVEIK